MEAERSVDTMENGTCRYAGARSERCQVVIPEDPAGDTEQNPENEAEIQPKPVEWQDPDKVPEAGTEAGNSPQPAEPRAGRDAGEPDSHRTGGWRPAASIVATLLVAAMVLAGLASLAGCSSHKSSSGASGSSATTATSDSSNDSASSTSIDIAEIAKFGSRCPIVLHFQFDAFQADNEISIGLTPSVVDTTYGAVKDVRMLVIFYDLYGDYVGDYQWEYASVQDSQLTLNTNGDKIGSIKIYTYSVLLDDGTYWGDKDATVDYMLLGALTESEVVQY